MSLNYIRYRLEHGKALKELNSILEQMPLEERTLWNESVTDIYKIIEKYPGLCEAVVKVFKSRFKMDGSI